MSQKSSATVRIVRRAGYSDMLRNYKIIVNGAPAGTIAESSVLDIDVPTGRATIEAQIDWGRSLPLIVDVEPGQTIEVEVSNQWGSMLSAWAITFGSKSYLKLERLPASSQ